MYTVLKKCSVVIRVSSERNVHRPFYAKTCSARLGLDWTRLGIKGFATFATLSSFFCMFVSTRPSISGVNKGGYWGYLPPPLESWG